MNRAEANRAARKLDEWRESDPEAAARYLGESIIGAIDADQSVAEIYLNAGPCCTAAWAILKACNPERKMTDADNHHGDLLKNV